MGSRSGSSGCSVVSGSGGSGCSGGVGGGGAHTLLGHDHPTTHVIL